MSDIELRRFENDLNRWYDQAVRSAYTSLTLSQLKRSGLIVYGASTIGKGVVSQLLQYDIRIDWIVDKNTALWGEKISGIEVKSIETLKVANDRFVLLASTHINQMIEECEKYRAKWILYSIIRDVCPLVTEIGYAGMESRHNKDIMKAITLFADQKSIDIYKAFLKYHYIFDNDFSTLNDPVEYFPADLTGKIDYSYFVDGGSYDGDTLKTWIAQYKPAGKACMYYAFEPSFDAYKSLEKFVSQCGVKDKVRMFNVGLGKKRMSKSVIGISNGMRVVIEAKSNNASEIVRIDTIDNLLCNNKITVIKADTEGYELELLQGALSVIKEQRPALLISVYHRFHDIWEIPEWINGLGLGYEIYLRHAPEVFTDTVCYAIAK